MPKLIATRGEKTDTEYEFQDRMLLGRSDECDIFVNDDTVSQQHAEIVRSGGDYIIRDLDSRNGTRVSGEKISQATLKNGSQIAIGAWELIFVTDEAQREDDTDSDTISVKAAVETEAQTQASEASHISDPSVLHERLKLWAQISKIIHSTLDIDRLLDEAARQTLVTFSGCSHCLILLRDDESGELVVKASQKRDEDDDESITISRTIANNALDSGESLLCSDVTEDTQYSEVRSVQNLDIRSFMCAPLIHRSRAFGVLYIDARHGEAELSKDDLRLLSAIANQIALAIENARLHKGLRLSKERLEEEASSLRQQVSGVFDFEGFVGTSKAMKDALEQAEKYSRDSTIPVLITGETGTGKELFARALHANSDRKDGPWIAVNCPTLPRELVESELFGHEPGAFTGATKRKIGKFELANGGTVLLDEVSEIPSDVQAKLLRALQEHEIERLGGAQTIKLDVRFIAATDRDLEDGITKGKFRESLYHRLRAASIHLPPLRERRDDILSLAKYFLSKFSREKGKSIKGFSIEAANALQLYHWPGNIRELEHLIWKLVIIADDDTPIDLNCLRDQIPAHAKSASAGFAKRTGPLADTIAQIERAIILDKLKETEGNVERAREALGLSKRGMRNKISRYELKAALDELRGK